MPQSASKRGNVAPLHLQLLAWGGAACAVLIVTFGKGLLRARSPLAQALAQDIINDELAASYRSAGMHWGFVTLLAGSVAMLVATL